MNEFVTEGHLGGYLADGDPDTIFPEMWTWLIEAWDIKSVIDVGCGAGVALRYFRDEIKRIHGDSVEPPTVVGIDGMPQPALPEEAFVQHDYATGPLRLHWECDLAWSAEFVEHVDERYVPNFMATFQAARFVLITHADVGSPGHHHVNCKSEDYWKGVFAGNGFEFDAVLTAQSRAASSVNVRPFNHYRRGGLAFRKVA